MLKDDIYTPYFSLSVGGKEFDVKTACNITDISIEEPIDGSKTLNFNIADPNLTIVEDSIFVEDASVTANIGIYELNYAWSFGGYISTIDIDFPEDGCPTLSIMCIDNSHLMNSEKKNRTWENVTRAYVIQLIAKEYGLGFKNVGASKEIQKSIVQNEETDIDFLDRLASEEAEPHRVQVTAKQVTYSKIDFKAPSSCTLNYRSGDCSLISFKPQINKETKQSVVSESDIDPSTKEVDVVASASGSAKSTIIDEPVEKSSTPTVKDEAQIKFDFYKQEYGKQYPNNSSSSPQDKFDFYKKEYGKQYN